jgi:hypothetical protein
MKPSYLIIAGLALNLIDLMTAKSDGTGGAVFGANGFLAGVNNALPQVKVPYFGTPINLGGWLIIAGAGWWAYREYV